MEEQSRELYKVSIYEIGSGDFIKRKDDRLVEVSRVEKVTDPEGRLKQWTIVGKDGIRYGMLDVRVYLKRCSMKNLVSSVNPGDVVELTLRDGSKVAGNFKDAKSFIGSVTHIILNSNEYVAENIASYEILKRN